MIDEQREPAGFQHAPARLYDIVRLRYVIEHLKRTDHVDRSRRKHAVAKQAASDVAPYSGRCDLDRMPAGLDSDHVIETHVERPLQKKPVAAPDFEQQSLVP